jgi:predicted GIY-YIG superfamily endonuclease
MRQDGAAEPLYIEDPLSKSAAASRERQLKGLSREKKLSLISGGSSQQR